MSKTFHIVCTDRGQHSRTNFPDLILRDDGTIAQVQSRTAPLAGPRTRKAVVPVKNHKTSPIGPWQWKCPRCGRDVPINEEKLLKWMRDTPEQVFDISRIP